MVVVLAILIVLLFPDYGYCFGPAFHLKIGYELLNYLTLFSPLTQQILSEHPIDFLYGNISPDVIIGKRFAPYHNHCHNWDIAKSILDLSKTNRQRSFAYGYLAHLASDVVAHNYFVPYQIISTYRTRTLTHLYWETRLDNKIEKDIWYLAEKFKGEDFSVHERLLEDTLAFNLFPFKIHSKIYKGYILFSSLDHWHKTIAFVKGFARYKIAPEIVEDVLSLSIESSLDVLLRRNDEYIYHADPMGKKAISMAQDLKKRLKAASSERRDTEAERLICRDYRHRLKKAFFNPDEFPSIFSAI